MTTPILEVRDISIRFGGVEALKHVSLQLLPGEVLALAGDNGAGKSTLIKIISGVYRADQGELLFDGAPLQLRDPQDARARGIETIYQDLALADNLDVGSNIFLGREPLRRQLGFQVIDRPRMAQVAREVLKRLDIVIPERKLGGPVKMLSGGERNRLLLARLFARPANFIVLDEPTNDLDLPSLRMLEEALADLWHAVVRRVQHLPYVGIAQFVGGGLHQLQRFVMHRVRHTRDVLQDERTRLQDAKSIEVAV